MSLEYKTRISRKMTLYIPKALAEAAGIKEGSYVKLKVKDSKIIIEPIPDPLEYALRGPKFAEVTFEEIERISEEIQDELFG